MKLSKVRRVSSGAPPSSRPRWRSSGQRGRELSARRRRRRRPRRRPEDAAARFAERPRAGAGSRPSALRTPIADALHLRRFAAVDREHAVRVMGLDPALEEAGRHRQMRAAVDDRLELEPAEPAREHVLAELRPQPPLDARPDVERRCTVRCVRLLGRPHVRDCPRCRDTCHVLPQDPPRYDGASPCYATASPGRHEPIAVAAGQVWRPRSYEVY